MCWCSGALPAHWQVQNFGIKGKGLNKTCMCEVDQTLSLQFNSCVRLALQVTSVCSAQGCNSTGHTWAQSRSLRAAMLHIGYWVLREHVGYDCLVMLQLLWSWTCRGITGTVSCALRCTQGQLYFRCKNLYLASLVSSLSWFGGFMGFSLHWKKFHVVSSRVAQDFHFLEWHLEVLGSNTAAGSFMVGRYQKIWCPVFPALFPWCRCLLRLPKGIGNSVVTWGFPSYAVFQGS